MALESPLSVLYNSEGFELAVSQSQAISGTYQPGLILAASGSDGRAHFLRVSNEGALVITGSIQTTAVATQSVVVDGWASAITASVRPIGGSTTMVSSANASLTSYTLLDANPNRRGATFYKEGSNICFLKLGATASPTSFTVKLSNNGYYELPEYYSGQVDIVFNSDVEGNTVHVTEIMLP